MHETLLMDAHVHIYPQFDVARAIEKSLANFIVAQRTSSNREIGRASCRERVCHRV